ncbi:hypothetical protein BVRB_6g141210 [Beta vulgaris subsp. vulgaris]|nr:hypothetical protein BVRB_6g141210 [Beta vulgaris subsp. vulgaris]
MAAEASKTTSSADSYIGSLISLTSKSEIRYEGILYSINTEESSIGLRNVRSFGTEGRKKDGPQVAPSDKVYEYILFRGSDIKDLQVKSSPVQPVASTSAVDNDPAIIQSHYPHPPSASTNLPPAVSAPPADANSHGQQLGHPGSSFPGALPFYQPGGNLGSWGPSPPPGANGSGLAMPMYWPGFYGPPNGLPHMPQQTLLRPPHGLSVPPSLQQPMQYSGFNPTLLTGASNLTGPKFPEIPPSLASSSSTATNVNVTSTSLPQFMPPVPSTSLASDTSSGSAVSKAPNTGLLLTPSFPSISSLAISAPDASINAPAVSNKVNATSSSSLPNPSLSQTTSSVISSSTSNQTETAKPSLVTPDQLAQSAQVPKSSSPSPQVSHKDVQVVQVPSASSSDAKAEVVKEAQPPILPLPPASRAFHKPNGTQFHPRHNYNYRGRERGRGSGSSRPVTRFTEDFDFTAMNEKFKKDEVWGHLGKSNKSLTKDKDGNGGDDSEEEGEVELPQTDAKPIYNKDDFFDTLSCNTLDHDSQNGRTRFSEQLKIDAETFGDFVRYRGGRGGRGPNRGGRGRGSYYGRGYGYPGRGRGRGMSNRPL